MGLPLYLALTGPELNAAAELPKHLAYMACHFSSYGGGLSNFPASLPSGSMLIVNDSTPADRHDPILICRQLEDFSNQWNIGSILLDFQRPENEETYQITKAILSGLSCPVIVSDIYAKELACPVFLPPVPADYSLSRWISPWKGREIWLEAALDAKAITVNKDGSCQAPVNPPAASPLPHWDKKLHCHYKIETQPDQVLFTLQRTEDDLTELLQEAEDLSVAGAVGLYQELGHKMHCN